MLVVASVFAAVIPMSTYLVIIWLIDRYDREPFSLVLKNYLWGALGAIILALIGSFILSTIISFFVPEKNLKNISTFFVAPFVEEITKGIFLLITVRNRKFDNLTDGIVYGGAIGLGFGMTENFLYFISYTSSISSWAVVVIIRTLFSAVMHCVSTATFGAALGFAKFKTGYPKVMIPLLGLFTAMIIHFTWNFSISFESTAALGFLFMIVTIGIFVTVFLLSVLSERKIIYNELLDEANNGLIPFDHLNILNSSKRNRPGWVDESIRKVYIRAATTLAFRKIEFKKSKDINQIFYRKDIEYYRNFIKNLLGNIRND